MISPEALVLIAGAHVPSAGAMIGLKMPTTQQVVVGPLQPGSYYFYCSPPDGDPTQKGDRMPATLHEFGTDVLVDSKLDLDSESPCHLGFEYP